MQQGRDGLAVIGPGHNHQLPEFVHRPKKIAIKLGARKGGRALVTPAARCPIHLSGKAFQQRTFVVVDMGLRYRAGFGQTTQSRQNDGMQNAGVR